MSATGRGTRLGGRRARGRNRRGGACNRTVRVAASQPEARDRGAFEARLSPKPRFRLRLGFALLRFARASSSRSSVCDRSSEIAPRVALGYPRVAPSRARRASRARAHLKLNRKHGNVPPDQHDRRRGDAEDQLSVLRRADVVHVLRVNVRLRASPRPRASSSSSVIPRRRVDVSSRARRVPRARVVPRASSRAVPPSLVRARSRPARARVVAAPVRPRRPSRFSSCARRVARTRSRRVVPRRRSRRT